jgi:hypothetical protein
LAEAGRLPHPEFAQLRMFSSEVALQKNLFCFFPDLALHKHFQTRYYAPTVEQTVNVICDLLSN